MIRLVAIDLDGTILDERLDFHPSIPSAFEEANRYGIGTVIATGRSIQSASRIAQAFPPSHGFICSNGCDVYGPGRESVQRQLLSPEVRKRTVEYADQNHFHISAYGVDDVYSIRESAYLDQYRALLGGARVELRSPRELIEMPLFKIVFIQESERIPVTRSEVSELLRDLEADFTESSPHYLEILPRNANKATGLKSLADFLEIQSNEIAAIGDYKNDLEMLKWVGLPGAMGNALPEVKAIAHQVVGTNQEGGVAQFLQFLIGQRS